MMEGIILTLSEHDEAVGEVAAMADRIAVCAAWMPDALHEARARF